MTGDALFEKRAVEIAKDLQKLNVDDLDKRGVDESTVSRRKTLHNLERARDNRHSVVNLDANFKRRLTILQNSDGSKYPQFLLVPESTAICKIIYLLYAYQKYSLCLTLLVFFQFQYAFLLVRLSIIIYVY